MKVSELIEELKRYNQSAEVGVVVDNKRHEFSIAFGSSEGVEKFNCETVSLYPYGLNSNELKE